MSTKFATLTFDRSEKWLDKQREIDGYMVDGFKVENIRGKTAEIIFFIGKFQENMNICGCMNFHRV